MDDLMRLDHYQALTGFMSLILLSLVKSLYIVYFGVALSGPSLPTFFHYAPLNLCVSSCSLSIDRTRPF